MTDRLFQILMLLLIALSCFTLGWQCHRSYEPPGYERQTEVRSHTDTTFVTHVDTLHISVWDTLRVHVPVPAPVAADTADPQVHTYNQAFNDSLLTGRLQARVRGKLLSWHFDYVPLFPRYITRTDTVFIDRQTTVTERLTPRERPVLTAGMWAGGTGEVFHYGPSVGWLDRSRRHWHYRYDLATGAHLVGVSFPLFSL